MKAKSIQDLLEIGLTYVLDFEDQIAREAGEMAGAAHNQELKEAFQKTVSKSQEYGEKVKHTFEKLGKPVQRNENHIAKAMVHEVKGMIANTDPGPVRDAALIVAANQQQLFRVASYGSLLQYAELIGKGDAAQGLKENLEDSKGGDQKLTAIGEQKVNPQAKAA